MKETLAGSLLLAHPALRDPNFKRSVVLMSAHNAEGALGVVLNRPLSKRLADLSADFALSPLAPVPLFKGGPVQLDQLILVAWQPHPEGFRLHFGVDVEKAEELAADAGTQLRGFLGYSGWSAGQLESEMEARTWIVSDVPADLLTLEEEALWRQVLGREGAEWRLLANEPDRPELN